MNLKEILERKKQKKEIEIEVEEIPYITNVKYLNSYHKSPLFFNIYSILIKNPYQDIISFNAFQDFILGNNVYVLNSFPSLNRERIFSLYMKHNPPQTPYQLHQLWIALNTIHLCIPAIYQGDIEEMVEDGKILP